ncbi:NAD(P)/FAD-dependent oxidoreductase [Variovorax sp. YR216]|uniref:NAD(P)/FAD-dependent oxidoreductase n=1 Tax=Variovorax sp. YR216 TaxID=1882828 RepID=UPI0008977A22|nr:NAD(P)/FAD-dependent oxidoreductase [Variovorax sp. YR216]SEB25484.1 NADH dehydrogenase [Variovorax sp. YR216]
MPAEKNIVIVGGGFAGTTLARSLERQLPQGWRVVLVSEESYTTFNPMLAEVVGASVFPEHVVAPIRQMLRGGTRSQFVMGRVLSIDPERRCVRAGTLAGIQDIRYEHLVLAFGTRANLDLVPGLADHALPLKLVGDAMFIRNRMLQRIARIELETDPAVRRRLGHFIVIGGGFSGVEVAGALADFLRGATRYYPRVRTEELQVTVIEGADRLLVELPKSLGLAAARSMLARRIEVRLNARAAEVDAGGVRLATGENIAGATVICTIGTRPNPLLEALPVPRQRGRIETAPDMSVPGMSGLWALGDCALVRNGMTQQFAPPTAQFAVAQARSLARNIVAAIEGRATQAFRHESKGMMATTGHLKGVASVFGLRLHGLPAWLLWRAYYLLLIPTAGRKVRIWLEWTWSMFFAADITHLRFTRTNEADAETARPAVEALSKSQPQRQP